MSQASDGLKADTRFRLRTLGSSALSDEAGAFVRGLGPGKPLAMLAYLVFHKSVRRDELIGLLWGDVVESKARNAFRQTLHRLRTALGEDMLSSEHDLIVLRGRDRLWCDAVAFQKAIAAGDIESGIELYGGKFLEGLEVNEEGFSDWVADQRNRFQAAYEGALASAAERALESGDWETAAHRAQALVAVSPHDGNAAVLEATALLAGGRRAEAITALTVYARRMETELGSKPSAAATSLLQSILASPTDADRPRGTRAGGSRFGKPEFVGRERELARMLALWRRASAGEGRGAVLRGELGIGKSRLVSEFLHRAPSIVSPLALQGQERHAAVALPYASIAEALRPALNAPGLAGASQHLLAEAARLLPELRDQFDLPEPVALSDDTERIRFYEGIAALIDAVSYEQPVCLVLEDLQYASASTLELVRYLSLRLRASPVLIVATWESSDGIRAPATAATSIAMRTMPRDSAAAPEDVLNEFELVEVQPLSPAESERLIRALLRGTDVADEEAKRLAGLSGGIPLRIAELAEQASAGAVAPALPATVRDVLWRRLQQCSPHEQRLFVAAALFSQAVGIRLLAAAAHVSEAAALEGVLSLERRGLLVQRDGRLTPASSAAADLALETTGAAGVTLLASWAADAHAAEPGAAHGELARLYGLADRRALAYRHARAAALAAAACGAQEETRRFLALASSSATSEKERSEIEALAVALGHTGQRLLAGSGGETATDPLPEAVAAPAEVPPASRAEPAIARKRSIRAWRAVRARPWLALPVAALLVAIVVIQSQLGERAVTRGNALVDTLILVERLGSRERRYHYATGLLTNEVRPMRRFRIPANAPSWLDSLGLPWINPRVAPDGRTIAVERVTATGVDVYVIDAATRAATPIAVGGGEHIIEGWSPDGERLLVVAARPSTSGAHDSDLYSYGATTGTTRLPVDTAAARSVVAARWSPNGTHVAWIAREGETRQQEVFVALADGSRSRNLSRHAAEDFDIAWSADGEHVAFTSERDGNAEIYSVEVATGVLRRMTFHPAQDGRPAFSPDGQFLAFESAREGRLDTYVMTSWAGAPRALVAPDARLEIVEWRGPAPPFVDAVSIRTDVTIAPGDSAVASAEATDQYGNPIEGEMLRWTALDPSIVGVRVNAATPSRVVLVAERQGTARIAVDVAGWRGDTVVVQVAPSGTAALRDGFEEDDISSFWIPLGEPASFTRPRAGRGGTRGLILNGDAQWETGVLGAQYLTLRPGLSVQAWVAAPFQSYGPLGREISIALVTPDPRPSLDSVSPQFLKLVSVSWLGEAARFRYSVEREFRTEPVILVGRGAQHVFRMTIEESGRAAFYVDGKVRWRSTVLALRPGDERRVQLWIGSKATGDAAVVDDVAISP